MKLFPLVSLVLASTASAKQLRRKLPSGGSDAAESQFSNFVELVNSEDRICGGILMENDIVVTAASCTFSADCSTPAGTSSKAYVKGSNIDNGAGVSRNWAEYVIHPNYSCGSETDNIAVIRLSSPVDVTPADYSKEGIPEAGTSVTAPGYGSGSATSGRGSLEMASLVVVPESDDSCSTGSAKSTLCANSDQQDLCEGDEGAPLLHGSDFVGIYSHGGSCQPSSGSPKFMLANYYKSWLVNQACDLNSEHCGTFGSICANVLKQAMASLRGVLGL